MQRSLSRANVPALSPEIYSLAGKKELGELCKVYPVWKQATSIYMLGQFSICWSAFGLVLASIMIAIMLFASKTSLLTLIFVIIVVGLLLLITLGCYLCLSRRIYAHWQLSLWQNGFIYEKRRTRQVFRWDQIVSIQGGTLPWRNGPRPLLYIYTVRRRDGYAFKLGSVFSDMSEFISVLLVECVRHLAAHEIDIVPPESTRTFYNFTLDRQGIGNKQETLGWQEIQELMTKNGTVTLRKHAE